MDPDLQAWLAGTTGIVTIEYHTRFPYVGDPFYQANVSEQEARMTQAGIRFVPSIRFDETLSPGSNQPAQYAQALSTRAGVPSGLAIEMSGTIEPGSGAGSVVATLMPEQSLPGSWALYVAVTESEIDYPAPNGIDVHHNVFRRFLGGDEGTPVNLGAGTPQQVTLPFTLASEWDTDHVRFVAFVRDQTSGAIEQGAVVQLDALVGTEPTTWGRIKAGFRHDGGRP